LEAATLLAIKDIDDGENVRPQILKAFMSANTGFFYCIEDDSEQLKWNEVRFRNLLRNSFGHYSLWKSKGTLLILLSDISSDINGDLSS
jgi:hypothetical protein